MCHDLKIPWAMIPRNPKQLARGLQTLSGMSAYATSALQDLKAMAPKPVVNAIQTASRKTGVDFAYLLQQARAESSFNAQAQAKTSSATGLYQFIESTWMNMVEKHGEKYGINTDGMSREDILALRKDPKKASLLAAEFASENKDFLERNWGGDVGTTELYFAHFMGAGGATAFLKAKDENPLQNGADLFPRAAAANRNVFFDRDTGQPRTLAGIYDFFDKKFQIGPEPSQTAQRADSAVFAKSNPSVRSDVFASFDAIPRPPSANGLFVNPIQLMLLTQLDMPFEQGKNDRGLF